MSSIKARQGALSWRQVGDDVIVLDEQTSKYLQLAGSGAVLWPSIVDGTSVDGLVTALQERYGIDEATARRDVEAFVADLTQRGLVAADPA